MDTPHVFSCLCSCFVRPGPVLPVSCFWMRSIGSRSSGQVCNSVQTRLLSVLLNEMDGIGLKTDERRGAERVLQAEGVDEGHSQEQVWYRHIQ